MLSLHRETSGEASSCGTELLTGLTTPARLYSLRWTPIYPRSGSKTESDVGDCGTVLPLRDGVQRVFNLSDSMLRSGHSNSDVPSMPPR